jgi:hypothetical protein
MSHFTHGADTRSIELQRLLPVFDGYPYLVSRIGHTALRHIALVPADWPRERIVALARAQAGANRFGTVACFAFDDAVYVTPEGSTYSSGILPAGLPVIDRLRLAEEFPVTPELTSRHALLTIFEERHRGEGFLIGDGLEGRRPATPQDRARLAGIGPDGLPPGLRRCRTCRQAVGECLTSLDDVVWCRCSCENDTRCARCGDPLAKYRLSAWYWDEIDREPWYYAAYSGLGHYCADDFTRGWVCPDHGPEATEVRVTMRLKVRYRACSTCDRDEYE